MPMRMLGYAIMAVGVVLLLGNITGAFRTFMFAGALTIGIGSMIARRG